MVFNTFVFMQASMCMRFWLLRPLPPPPPLLRPLLLPPPPLLHPLRPLLPPPGCIMRCLLGPWQALRPTVHVASNQLPSPLSSWIGIRCLLRNHCLQLFNQLNPRHCLAPSCQLCL